MYVLHVMSLRHSTITLESHPRLYGRPGQYSTIQEHMPEDHKKFIEWNAQRFISWAESVGPNTLICTKSILSSHKVEQQGYRGCMALLKLADKYSVTRLETACEKALSYTPKPNYQNIKTILSTGQDKVIIQEKISSSKSDIHGFTKGADYYGRKS